MIMLWPQQAAWSISVIAYGLTETHADYSLKKSSYQSSNVRLPSLVVLQTPNLFDKSLSWPIDGLNGGES